MNLQKLIYKAEFEAIVLNVYEELLAWVRANPSYREEIPCEACIDSIIKSAHGHIIELVGDTEKIIADIYREFCRDLGGSYKWLE
ncbi:MAG: hypothetical protein HZT40_01360 [Candidatus Thiothrix singaporensis]|uniref:Uncharacterized protein n=1 Tax=Candidatus Thiothrix singaporensis TaxID=2799669 RepID=A0A7L6AN65_9GAMM|nr:MAG: hypothetical protein HZT40_01360 [Candidatus Thiothrix singaporensis]